MLLLDVEWLFKMNFGTSVDLRPNNRSSFQNRRRIIIYFKASKIVGCKLERQTDMTFDLYVGACNTFNEPNPIVLLCFDSNNNQECHMWVLMCHSIFQSFFSSFDGKVYEPAGNSSYSHGYTYGMANYKGKALTTGCDKSSDCDVKTEMMDMNSLTWSVGPDYPFGS